jgi:phosphoribosylaminoimidazolecarboxamide formyltransferase/IMP cyclohydrolase
VVNLYPFEETVAHPDVSLTEAIENIDIGGPSMLRSAAKNHESVTVVVDPGDYEAVAAQIKATGETSIELRRKLAAKVFARTAAYDRAIAAHLSKCFGLQNEPGAEPDLPENLEICASRAQNLRYGENPHQRAVMLFRFFPTTAREGASITISSALSRAALIGEFSKETPTIAILKHTNPCGVGQGVTLREAWDKAWATDTQAPFGGIIAVNQPLDLACAQAISEIFSEVILAPEFRPDALELLRKKKNLRLLRILKSDSGAGRFDIRSVGADSFLLQERDAREIQLSDCKVATKRKPSQPITLCSSAAWSNTSNQMPCLRRIDRTLGLERAK